LNTKIILYDKKLDTIQSDLDTANSKISDLEKNNSYLELKIDSLESQNKKNNLIFFGVNESDDNIEDIESKIINILTENCKLDIDSSKIENCFRLGKRNPENIRPILLVLNSIKIKQNILKSSKLLKGTNIFISQDYTPKMREKRQFLQHCAKKAIDFGHIVKIYNDGIKVNNDLYFKTEDLSSNEWLVKCNSKKVSSPTVTRKTQQNKRIFDNVHNNAFK
jgi:hypothetical protein